MTETSKQRKVGLSVDNTVHLVVCLALLGCFAQFSLRPACARHQELCQRIWQSRCLIAEHTALMGLDTALCTELALPQGEAMAAAPVIPLERDEFASIHVLLKDVAERCGLQLLQAAPRVSSRDDGRRFLGVNIRAEGPFSNMHAFLEALMDLPSFFYLERLNIGEGDLNKERIEVQVWLLVR